MGAVRVMKNLGRKQKFRYYCVNISVEGKNILFTNDTTYSGTFMGHRKA